MEQEEPRRKSRWSWEMDETDLKNQVDNYNTLRITQSYRGRSVLIMSAILGLSLLVSLLGRAVGKSTDPTSVFLDIIIFLPILFFVYKGHRWAIVLLMVSWTLDKGFSIYRVWQGGMMQIIGSGGGIMRIIWWLVIMPFFWRALEIENERRKISKLKVSQTGSDFRNHSGSKVALPFTRDIIFSDHKGIYKPRIEKRQTKLMEKIPFITPFLNKDEKIILITQGCSPMSLLEQLTTGLVLIFLLKRALFVFTDKRIFHIPTTRGYSYRNSIANILYGYCQTIKMKGRRLAVKYMEGKREVFYYISRKEIKKIKALLETIAVHGEQSKAMRRVHLCPRCTKELIKDEYICPSCHLEFKNKNEGMKISISYPGGGYFYTRHAILGVLDAIIEAALTIGLVISAVKLSAGKIDSPGPLIAYAIAPAIEKAITVYHTNHFIKEYIPKEKEISPTMGRV